MPGGVRGKHAVEDIESGVEIPMERKLSAVHSDPEILSGMPVFVGTRVPFQNLIDYLEAGHTLSEFLDDFPSVSHDQALAALEEAKEAVLASARAAG
jgi:uncharacterized protein (DUF433 family)